MGNELPTLLATSESANSQNKPSPKQTSSTIVPDTNTPMPDPDFEPEDDNKKTEVYKPKDNVERAIKDATGNVRGYKNKGAGEDVRTVTPAEFDQIKSELMKSVQGQPRQLGNNALSYQTKDGGKFSIRQSAKNGETIDIINAEQYGLPKSFRIHKQ